MTRLASSPACGPAASSSPFWPTALEPLAPAPEASEPAPTWEAGGGGGTFGFLLAQAVKPRQATNSTTRILRIHPSPKCRPRLAAFLLTHGLLNKPIEQTVPRRAREPHPALTSGANPSDRPQTPSRGSLGSHRALHT